MPDGSPPSSRASHLGNAELDAARGMLRESLGALGNLYELSRSRRVGPKALASLIPDVSAALAPMRGATRELMSAVARHPEAEGAVQEIESFASPRFDELERALALAAEQPMAASNRLKLEAAVGRASEELRAVRELIELLDDAVHYPTIPLDLFELVRGVSAAQTTTGSGTLVASLNRPSEPVELTLNPRVAVALLTLGAGFVSAPADTPKKSEQALRISILPAHPGAGRLEIDLGERFADSIELPRPRWIEPTRRTMEAAALLSGSRLELTEARMRLLWENPSAGER